MLILAVLFASACATTAAPTKVDAETLWQQGMEKLKAEKWGEASRIFQRFTLEFPTDARYQEARYHMAEAHYGAEEYITSATEFSRLAADFPGGPFGDDAQYMVCESYHQLSPDVELDQEYTQAAIDHCRVLLAYFPNSEYAPKATAILKEMTEKLAHKMYGTGDYYFRRKAYDSAIMYYELVVSTYPTTTYAPKALKRMIDAYQILGYETEEAATRARLLRDYPAAAPSTPPDTAALR
jgi:outer membrane protein assembly factor BamD